MTRPDPRLIAELANEEVLEWFDAPCRKVPRFVRLLVAISGALLVLISASVIYALVSGSMPIFAGDWLTFNDVPVTENSGPNILLEVLLLTAFLLAAMLLFAALLAASIRSDLYGLTNRRILRLRTFPWRQLKSLKPASVSLIRRDSNKAIGSLSLFTLAPGWFASFLRAFRVPTLILHDIANPADVERLLLERTA